MDIKTVFCDEKALTEIPVVDEKEARAGAALLPYRYKTKRGQWIGVGVNGEVSPQVIEVIPTDDQERIAFMADRGVVCRSCQKAKPEAELMAEEEGKKVAIYLCRPCYRRHRLKFVRSQVNPDGVKVKHQKRVDQGMIRARRKAERQRRKKNRRTR